MPNVWLIAEPLPRQRGLAVASRRDKQDDFGLRLGKQARQSGALDDVAPRGRRAALVCLPSFHCQREVPAPAGRLVAGSPDGDRRKGTSRACDRERPQARCRQSPASVPGSEAFESGSSPVCSR